MSLEACCSLVGIAGVTLSIDVKQEARASSRFEKRQRDACG